MANVTISTAGEKFGPVFFARFPSIPALGARRVERALFTLKKNKIVLDVDFKTRDEFFYHSSRNSLMRRSPPSKG